MFVSDKYKITFIHIPKSAGTSLRKCLSENDENFRQVGQGHSIIKDGMPKEIRDYKTFTVVRNPWDRMVSLYKFCTEIKTNSRIGPKGYFIPNKDIIGLDFNIWLTTKFHGVFKVKSLKGRSLTKIPQLEWIDMPNNKIAVDHILRFENINEDFKSFCGEVGIPNYELPYMNKTNRKHYSEYYNDKSIDWVSKYFERDIKEFGYEF